MLTKGEKRVTMPGQRVFDCGWNFTPTKFNFFASSCPRKRDRMSRKDWISSLNVRNGAARRGGGDDGRRSRENQTERGGEGGLCGRRVKE